MKDFKIDKEIFCTNKNVNRTKSYVKYDKHQIDDIMNGFWISIKIEYEYIKLKIENFDINWQSVTWIIFMTKNEYKVDFIRQWKKDNSYVKKYR